MIRKYQETSSVASRSRIFVWNGLFGVTEISLEIDVKSVKPKDHLWIFGQQRQLRKCGMIYILHVTSWSSAACIYNLHLQRHFLAPPAEASCRVACDGPAGTRIFRNTQIVHLFLEVFRFLSWSKVHLHLLSEVVVSFIWSGNKLTCAA